MPAPSPVQRRANRKGTKSPVALTEEMPHHFTVLERLKEIIRLGDMKAQQMADAMGVNVGHLSRVLKPASAGGRVGSEDFLQKAWTFIRLWEMKKADGDAGKIVPTSVTRRVAKLCTYCQVERCIGMLISETSAGKTSAMQAYCETNPSAIYVHGSARTNKVASMVRAIWLASKAFRGHKTLTEQWEAIVRGFRTEPGDVTTRILLVDDAHVLSYGTLEALREIHDDTGIGLVLAGTTRLDGRVSLAGDAHQMFEQLRARVMLRRIIRKPTRDDVAAVAAAWAGEGTRFTPSALAYLCELSQGLGALRLVKSHVRMALRLGGRDKVPADKRGRRTLDKNHLETAHGQLLETGSSLA